MKKKVFIWSLVLLFGMIGFAWYMYAAHDYFLAKEIIRNGPVFIFGGFIGIMTSRVVYLDKE